jgi:lysyl-tRNA synthetase class 2
MLAAGRQPYAVGFPRSTTLRELRSRFGDLPPATGTGETVGVTGRVIFIRNTGKLCFARLREGDGTELQAMLSEDRVGEQPLADWKSLVDIGDHVGVVGEVVTSRRGELSVLADRWELTSKALRPLPVEHRPLSEETRVRQRYVDLIVRPQARENARRRIATVRSLRRSLEERGFLEVETPMLQTLHGGAAARPFVTHSNAFDLDLYLRIAPELFLKRCVVGGLDRVFEINRNFRNEGADSSHSPEFAMLEAYQAYADYSDMAQLTQALVQQAARDVCGGLTVTLADGSQRDLSGQWQRVSLCELTGAALGEQVGPDTPYERLAEHADRVGLRHDPAWIHGKLLEELFEHVALPLLDRPTFVCDYPVDTSPLVRDHRSRPGLVEKWDLYVDGIELATGYTELVDPVIQRDRLTAQARLAEAGDAEAMHLDEDFLRAMEHGLPPLGGIGMGIDRLLMALTGLGIRETILFPLVKPE